MNVRAGSLITQVKQISARIFEKILLNHNIDDFNGAQGHILFVLWQENNLSLKEVSLKTGLATTTLTSMVDRMEKLDLVKRKIDSNDRRKVHLCLTNKAKKLEHDYRVVSDEMMNIFYEGFSESDILKFELFLDKILNNLRTWIGE